MTSLCERFYSIHLFNSFFPKILTHETNNTQHLNKTTILRPLYLRDINDCFCICSKHKIAQKLKYLDNVTLLSGHKVSFMHAKTTSNTLQCLQNELQQTLKLYVR